MRVFADLHHAELYYSLQLLFEKRLGAELYRPIGLDWYEQGYWHVFPHIDTARQFLGTDQAINIPKDVHGNPLPTSARVNQFYRFEDGIYYVTDVTKGKVNRGITLDKFKEMEFDVLIASMPNHIGPYQQLIQRFQPKAKLVFQVGNAWGYMPGVKNVLSSTAPFTVPAGINACFYHQEFDLDTFKYEEPSPNRNRVTSYIHYMRNKELMDAVAARLPGWEFRSYGADMEDSIMETSKLADSMRDSSFVWHYKPEGDGYGHVIHNAFAVGRPPIVWGDFYRGKIAWELMEDGVTCIDISRKSADQIAQEIQYWSDPERHIQMSKASKDRFASLVDFDREEQEIRKFLENLR